jgi:thiamine-monophosphate kinase
MCAPPWSTASDYELAFTLAAKTDPDAFIKAWRHRFPRTRISCIGKFVRPSALQAGTLDLAAYRGFEHLR